MTVIPRVKHSKQGMVFCPLLSHYAVYVIIGDTIKETVGLVVKEEEEDQKKAETTGAEEKTDNGDREVIKGREQWNEIVVKGGVIRTESGTIGKEEMIGD